MSDSAPATTIPLSSLYARGAALADPLRQLDLLGKLPVDADFEARLAETGLSPLQPVAIDVLQVNVGKMCNQTCAHCHVDAGPDRTEIMTQATMEACLAAVRANNIPVVDLTGGAPEMNPHFRWFVERLTALGTRVIDRCNLTILTTRPHADTAAFLARHRVEIVCSLPHCRRPSTDRQRGDGVFDKSIAALQALNALGYGEPGSDLLLNVVTNPVGAFLPGDQAALQREWKRELMANFGVRFNQLYTITNMPVSRFLEWLRDSGNLTEYMRKLVQAYNPAAASGVMCRNIVSVGWDGRLYDCDFNQMLEMPIDNGPSHIRDFDAAELLRRTIRTARHCFGCTAGAGSSCGGQTA